MTRRTSGNGNGGGNYPPWQIVGLILNALVLLVLTVFGNFLRTTSDTIQKINERVATLQANRDADRKDIDRNVQKIEELQRKYYERTPKQ